MTPTQDKKKCAVQYMIYNTVHNAVFITLYFVQLNDTIYNTVCNMVQSIVQDTMLVPYKQSCQIWQQALYPFNLTVKNREAN